MTSTAIQDWQYLTVDECMDAIIDYRGKSPRKTTFGIPLVTAKIVKNGRIETPTEFIAASEYDAWMRRGMPKSGDVLVTTEAPLGEVAQLDDRKVALAQRLIALRGKAGVLNNTYLRFAMQSAFVQDQLLSRATGTTVFGIRQSELRQIIVPVPPVIQQERIASILGTLDDKIELNRRTNETLETMARRLLRSWFVDFDPVHAKAGLCREYPKLSNADLSRRALPNMAPEIAELFPVSFEDSTLGPIPKGWKAGTVPDAVEVNPSRSIAKGTIVPWLEMANMPTRSARALAWERREFKSGTKFINGDTLVARITPCLENGKTAFVDFLEDDEAGAGSTEYIVLRPKPPLPPVFAYLLARTDDFRQHLITNMTGTSGRQRAPANCLNTFPLVTPPEEIAECFARTTGDLFAQMKTNDEESFALTATRDRLLPRLLSGEIAVTSNGGAHEST